MRTISRQEWATAIQTGMFEGESLDEGSLGGKVGITVKRFGVANLGVISASVKNIPPICTPPCELSVMAPARITPLNPLSISQDRDPTMAI